MGQRWSAPGQGDGGQVGALESIGDELCSLAGHIAAATARFLALLADFDSRDGWCGTGIVSCAHWLSWRCGMDLRTAREQLRVARSLTKLPHTAAAFGAGRLSYSKVRAIARVATPETEQDLVGIAVNAPAAHLERLVRGLCSIGPITADDHDDAAADGPGASPASGAGAAAAAAAAAAGPSRWHIQHRWDDDTGDLVLWGRLGPHDGAIVLAALSRAELERVRTAADTDGAPDAEPEPNAEPRADADTVADAGTVAGSRHGLVSREESPGSGPDLTGPAPSDLAPALVAMAQIAAEQVAAPAHAIAAEVLFVHNGDTADHGAGSDGPARADAADAGGLRVNDGPALCPEAAAEVECDAFWRDVTQQRGCVLSYGRRRRAPSSAQLHALHLRDACCQTPGCGRTRFLHAHHVTFWRGGGHTDLDNLILLCGTCHRSLHLGRFTVTALGAQRFEFRDTDDRIWPAAPPMSGLADKILTGEIPMEAITGGWNGEPLRPGYAISVLVDNWFRSQHQFGGGGAASEPISWSASAASAATAMSAA